MAGLSAEHFPALLKLCTLEKHERELVVPAGREDHEYKVLVQLYGSRNRNKLLQRLQPVRVIDSCLARDGKIVLPIELWKFASSYAGASIGLGDSLGRRISAESVQRLLETAFDVCGKALGTLTIEAIRESILFAASAELSEAARIARSAEQQEPGDGASGT
jgi:hypothetical protein